MQPTTTWRGRLIAMAIGIAVLAVVSELLLRTVMPNWREYHSGRFITTAVVPGHGVASIGVPGFDGWFAQNNGDFRTHIRINSAGLRNDEAVEAADGRVWVVGDSMSFGWGVAREETYTQILANRLKFGAYNVATPGSNVCGWQALYARMPHGIRPAAVVVGLTIENRVGNFDCAADAKAASNLNERPALSGPFDISASAIKLFLTQHLAAYNFLAVSLKRVGFVTTALTKIGLIKDPHGILLHDQDPSKASVVIRSTADELRRLRAMAPPDIPFLVVLFPARFELRDGTRYFHQTRTGVAQALSERSIDTLDLFPEFKSAGMEATHFAHDGHWNAAGHRIAGEAIARWFADRRIPALLDQNRPR